MKPEEKENKFFCDRMAGSLCKYLRFMGYDSISANILPPGNPREDTIILEIAGKEQRIILTQDAELARRGDTKAVRLCSSDLSDQINQLVKAGLIVPQIRLTRCSLCNTLLLEGASTTKEQEHIPAGTPLAYCPVCKRHYWEGTHTMNLRRKLDQLITRSDKLARDNNSEE